MTVLNETMSTSCLNFGRQSKSHAGKACRTSIWALSAQKWLFFPRVMQIYTKFSNFTELYFPHFTKFRNQTLQFYSFQDALSWCGVGFHSSCHNDCKTFLCLKVEIASNSLLILCWHVFDILIPGIVKKFIIYKKKFKHKW